MNPKAPVLPGQIYQWLVPNLRRPPLHNLNSHYWATFFTAKLELHGMTHEHTILLNLQLVLHNHITFL